MDGGGDEFLYRVTHDLKSCMRAIRVIPEWVAEDLTAHDITLPPEVAEHFEMLTAHVRAMDRMLESLTELSRAGRLADPAQPHDLAELARDAWAACPGHEALRFEIEGAAVLRAPGNDLRRLLSALLSNAILFNDSREGRVRVRLEQSGGAVGIQVADNGPGIDPAHHEAVFQPLVTLQPKDSFGTCGIGLAVARKVVTGLGGCIRIDGGLDGRGCSFAVTLPQGGAA